MLMAMKGIVYADGGSRGNPGPAGIGAVLKDPQGKKIHTVSESIGIATNNTAEYTALVRILEEALKLGYDDIEVFMDSELVVRQMLGLYKVKNEGLMPLFDRASMLANRFKAFHISHVRREANKEADKLANRAMDAASAPE